jgi:F-type H+-transporting ATPase subunit delta
MNESLYARYAYALRDLALEEKAITKYQEAILEIDHVFQDNPNFLATLSSYAIPKEKLYPLVNEAFSHYGLKHLVSFLSLLIDKHLIDHFHDIAIAFNSAANESRGVLEGIVYSTVHLSKDEIQDLEASLKQRLHHEVELTNRLEPDLLGGIKVYLDGKIYDGSLLAKVEGLRSALLKNESRGEKL